MKSLGWELLGIGLVLLSTLPSVSTQATGIDFVTTLERAVKEIAGQAVYNFEHTCDLVRTCQGSDNCSRLECHPTYGAKSDDYQCATVSDTAYCPNNTIIQANVGRSYARIPPFTTLGDTNEPNNNNSRGYTVCAQRELEGKFKELYSSNNDSSAFLALYLGAADGTFFFYPGREILPDNCQKYDPRKRNWYIGASSVLVDVVVLLDTGRYMSGANFDLSGTALDSAIAVTTNLSQTIPQTGQTRPQPELPPSRFTVLPFNESGVTVPDASRFQYAVPPDIDTSQLDFELRNSTEYARSDSSTTGQSNFTAAFLGAQSVFTSSNPQALQVVILFTDLAYVSEKPSPSFRENQTVFQLWRNRQPGQPGARLFIYDFGQTQPRNWTNLASQVDGYYGQIESTMEVAKYPLLGIKSYFDLLAQSRILATNNSSIFWQPTYEDASGLGQLITVSYPAMNSDGLIGVAGIDIKFVGSDQSLSTQINNILESQDKLNETSIATYPAGASIASTGTTGNENLNCGNTPSNYEPLCDTPQILDNRTLVGLLCGCPAPSKEKFPIWIILLAAIGGSAALLVTLLLAIICCIRRHRKGRDKLSLKKFRELSLDEFSFEELKQGTTDFDKNSVIGEGMFGVVYKGVVRDNKVAVKQMRAQADSAEDFKAEMMTLGITENHPNLVELKGFCFQPPQCFLVYELLETGDLETWLFPRAKENSNGVPLPLSSGRDRFLTWTQRRKIAIGTAEGLNYLHHRFHVKQIFHLDIKPRNILLDEDFNPKVADFGISQIYEHGHTMDMMTLKYGTPGYAAPEVMTFKGTKPSSKLDVYSFGMVLLQLMSGRQHFYKDPETGKVLLDWTILQVNAGQIAQVVDKRMIDAEEEQDKKAVLENSKQLIELALQCLSDDPRSRPEMSKVLDRMKGLPVREQNDQESIPDLHLTPVDGVVVQPSEESEIDISERLFPNSQPTSELGTEELARFAASRSRASTYRRRSEKNVHEDLLASKSTSYDQQQEEIIDPTYYDRSDDSSDSDPDRATYRTPPESPLQKKKRRRDRKSKSLGSI